MGFNASLERITILLTFPWSRLGVSKLSWPATYYCKSLKAKTGFHIFKWLTIFIMFCDMWKSYEIQISVSIHKVLWNITMLFCFHCFHKASFGLKWQRLEVQQRSYILQNLKFWLFSPFWKKFASLCSRIVFHKVLICIQIWNL